MDLDGSLEVSHGASMGLPWPSTDRRWTSIGLSWYRSPMGVRLVSHGLPWTSMDLQWVATVYRGLTWVSRGVIPWISHGSALGFHGTPTGSFGSLVVSHGGFMGLPWVSHGSLMGIRWIYMGLLWVSYGFPWVARRCPG